MHAWGLNNFGHTGVASGGGGEEDRDRAVVELPTPVRGLAEWDIGEVQGGNHHSIACTRDGTVLSWGRCDDGQMGVPLDAVPPEQLRRDDRGRPRILPNPTVVPSKSSLYLLFPVQCYHSIRRRVRRSPWPPVSTIRSRCPPMARLTRGASRQTTVPVCVQTTRCWCRRG